MFHQSTEESTDRSDAPLWPMPSYDWEAQDDDQGWLVSYADVLSVILAMVVVLLGKMSVTYLPPTVQAEPLAEIDDTTALSVAQSEVFDVDSPDPKPKPSDRSSGSRARRLTELVEKRFQGTVTAVQHEEGVSLQIAEVILFDTARAVLQESARPVLSRLAMTLREIGEADIAVEGHTDSRPVQGGEFASNWELAAARAIAVTRFLLSQRFAAARLRSVSYADTQPVSDNATLKGRAANRRVELRVEFPTPNRDN